MRVSKKRDGIFMEATCKGFLGKIYALKSCALALLGRVDFIPLLLLRLYLAPIFIAVGLHKLTHFNDIVKWFADPDWGLGLPFPMLMAALAIAAELGGGVCVLLGFATRLVSIPMIITMVVAITSVHWDKGWFAVAPSNPNTSMAKILVPFGFPGAQESLDNSVEVGKRLRRIRVILQKHGNYDWLNARGNIVILNNGIEFPTTYLMMLLVLLFGGAGRYVSIDYWVERWFSRRAALQ